VPTVSSKSELLSQEVDQAFARIERKPLQAKVSGEGENGIATPFSFSGSDTFDDNDHMETLAYVPDLMLWTLSARVIINFREFSAPATAASSGGADTSGASSAGSSAAGGGSTPTSSSTGHFHMFGSDIGTGALGVATRRYADGVGQDFVLDTDAAGAALVTHNESPEHSHDVTIGTHTHTIAHTHTTPNHTHGLTYGVFKETYPVSHNVTLRVARYDAGTGWDELAIITGLTDDVEDVDLTDYITGPGVYRITLRSTTAQPQGGRLGANLAGYVVGMIQTR